MADEVIVTGYTELVRACVRADADTKKYMRATFRQVGDIVKVDAARLFTRYSAKSAAGYRTRVRQRGISVEQVWRERGALYPGADLSEGDITRGRDVVGERGEAAVVTGAEPVGWQHPRGGQDLLTHLLWRFHPRVDRVGYSDEDPRSGRKIAGDDPQGLRPVGLTGKLQVEGARQQREELG